MIKWLKSLFGFESTAEVPVTAPVKEEPKVEKKAEPAPKAVKAAAPAKKTTKKTATKKAAKTDLGSMSKNDLLAHAKKNGIKANASMKKADILAAINNG